MAADNSNRLQARVPAYHKWVVEELVGTEGRNEGDVLARIIGFWINENEAWLEKRGVSVERFLSENGGAQMEGKLLPMRDVAKPRDAPS